VNLGAGGDELTGGQLVAVAERMRAGGVPPAGPLEAELIAGGRSNLTYRLTDGSRRWVLRTPPRHGRTPSAHDVVREYRVTAALGPTDVPVPPAVLLCEDDEPIGGPFVISDYVDGAVV
jgi:aminoglycoside phosphotransferase (APT) family kinase protein